MKMRLRSEFKITEKEFRKKIGEIFFGRDLVQNGLVGDWVCLFQPES